MGWSENDFENKKEFVMWERLVRAMLKIGVGKSIVLIINCDS